MMPGDDQMMTQMVTRMTTIIVASSASRTAVMIQCCVKRDDDDHDDNGTGVMIVIIRVIVSSSHPLHCQGCLTCLLISLYFLGLQLDPASPVRRMAFFPTPPPTLLSTFYIHLSNCTIQNHQIEQRSKLIIRTLFFLMINFIF